MAKRMELMMLMDCYEAFLTPRQVKFMTQYYGEDLSMGEIAQLSGITRQGVCETLKRSETILQKMEEHLHLAEKLSVMRQKVDNLERLVNEMTLKAQNPVQIRTMCAQAQKELTLMRTVIER